LETFMPETLTPIQLPDFARMLLGEDRCKHCVQRPRPTDVKAAGIQIGKCGDPFFFYEFLCSNCREYTVTAITSRRIGPLHWARQIATWIETGSNPHFLVDLPANPITLSKAQPNPNCGLPMPVHGGYQALDDGSVMLLVRQHAPFTTDPYRDCLCLVQSHSRLRFSRLKDNECILDDDWPQFLAAADGYEFRIRNRMWRKMSRPEIEAVVKDRHFRDASKVRHRPKPK
jgi:hypothetical protein